MFTIPTYISSHHHQQLACQEQLRWLHNSLINFSKNKADILSWQTPINTLRPRQMDAIAQRTFSNAFSWMNMFEFLLKFHWSLFPRVELTIFQYWFRLWLGADQATSHYLNQWWLDYRRIYASLGLNELSSGRALSKSPVITWASADSNLCWHITSPGYNELTSSKGD